MEDKIVKSAAETADGEKKRKSNVIDEVLVE